MKVIGRSGPSHVLVEMSAYEFEAIGGTAKRCRHTHNIEEFVAPQSIEGLAKCLEQIKYATPDLKRIRATMQSFLALTEPEELQKVLANCTAAELTPPKDESNA